MSAANSDPFGEKISSGQAISFNVASQDIIKPGIVTARETLTMYLLTLLPLILAASPATPLTLTSFPSRTPIPTLMELEERCSSGCGSLDEFPLTTAIVSTTSVPCYLTTTVISTIYATETITLTITRKGTVYIIEYEYEYEYEYSPTPVVVYSTPVESVLALTVSWMSFWVGVGVGSEGGYESFTPSSHGDAMTMTTTTTTTTAAVDGGDAWTHVNTNVAADGSGTSTSINNWDSGTSVTADSGHGWTSWSAARRKVDPSPRRIKVGYVVITVCWIGLVGGGASVMMDFL